MLNSIEKGFVKFIDNLATRVYAPYTEAGIYQPKVPKKPVK